MSKKRLLRKHSGSQWVNTMFGAGAYNRPGKEKGYEAGGKTIPGYRVSLLVILNTRQDLLDYVSENSGQEVDVSTMYQIRDPLICEVNVF